jgi:hypothetical protein
MSVHVVEGGAGPMIHVCNPLFLAHGVVVDIVVVVQPVALTVLPCFGLPWQSFGTQDSCCPWLLPSW